MEEEGAQLLRAAEELGIDLSGVRAGDGEAADEQSTAESKSNGDGSAGGEGDAEPEEAEAK